MGVFVVQKCIEEVDKMCKEYMKYSKHDVWMNETNLDFIY